MANFMKLIPPTGSTRGLFPVLCFLILCLSAAADQAHGDDHPVAPMQHKHHITGLFMPEREQDLRDLIDKLPDFKLISIDYSNAEAVLEYDAAALWPGEKPEKHVELLNNQLSNASRGTFGVKPLSTIPPHEFTLVEIPVIGLDCKACSFAAYELVFRLPGVERATASFKAGKVTALIDPKLMDQAKLEDALRKGGVEIPASATEDVTANDVTANDEPAAVRVLIWDEQQPEQKQAYGDRFLGETIAASLEKRPGFTVRAVNLDSPAQGLDDATLDATDVIIWWGHIQHGRVSAEGVERVVKRVQDGKLSLIALHSAHFAEPFMRLMYERAKADAPGLIPESEKATARLDLTAPLKRQPVKADSPLTPALEKIDGGYRLIPPACVFPSWRADGAASHVKTLLPEHPIAKGLPLTWDVPHTEMYSEPYHVPAPDAVIFEERWDKGEHFRSGCVWKVGKGRVFYFRPGHETYPVYSQPEPLQVLENAARWMTHP